METTEIHKPILAQHRLMEGERKGANSALNAALKLGKHSRPGLRLTDNYF